MLVMTFEVWLKSLLAILGSDNVGYDIEVAIFWSHMKSTVRIRLSNAFLKLSQIWGRRQNKWKIVLDILEKAL